jgi:shikimate dehydrogenase
MKLYGLIGNPLTHSASEGYFTEKFRKQHLEARYRLFPLASIEELPGLLEQHDSLAGLNVTIPYKSAVISSLDELSREAYYVGAVNVINIQQKNGRRHLKGYNTDVAGFESLLKPVIKGRNITFALILGTGGASRAVQYVLRKLGIGYLLVSRKGLKSDQLTYPLVTSSIIRNHQLIINCTPVGMYPDTEEKPELLYRYIGKEHILIDLIYNPAETQFVRLGKLAGATTVNGQVMFEKQAEESWKIWNK